MPPQAMQQNFPDLLMLRTQHILRQSNIFIPPVVKCHPGDIYIMRKNFQSMHLLGHS